MRPSHDAQEILTIRPKLLGQPGWRMFVGKPRILSPELMHHAAKPQQYASAFTRDDQVRAAIGNIGAPRGARCCAIRRSQWPNVEIMPILTVGETVD
jgi:hypothetical protein